MTKGHLWNSDVKAQGTVMIHTQQLTVQKGTLRRNPYPQALVPLLAPEPQGEN